MAVRVDGSGEAMCTGTSSPDVESSSGRTITVDTSSTSTGAVHDRVICSVPLFILQAKPSWSFPGSTS